MTPAAMPTAASSRLSASPHPNRPKLRQTAARDFNVNLVYHSPSTTNPQAEASLITQAAARHPKGLVVTIPDAAALSGPVRQAVSAGVPVIVMNVGVSVYQNVGGLTFVGQDEIAAGQEAGREMTSNGVTKALCVIHEEKNTALVDRCSGFARALAARGGSVTTIHVNGAQLNAAANVIAVLAAFFPTRVILSPPPVTMAEMEAARKAREEFGT